MVIDRNNRQYYKLGRQPLASVYFTVSSTAYGWFHGAILHSQKEITSQIDKYLVILSSKTDKLVSLTNYFFLCSVVSIDNIGSELVLPPCAYFS